MSLYPTFEDLKIGLEVDAQNALVQNVLTSGNNNTAASAASYSSLAQDFLGLDLAQIQCDTFGNKFYQNEPNTQIVASASHSAVALSSPGTIVNTNPVNVTQGVRGITLCKNARGHVGLQLRNQDNGVFVTFVESGSPAALAGLRFGDQVLELNGHLTAGKCGADAMELIKKGPINNIKIVIRDRPLERCVTLLKDSSGSIGIFIKDGAIESIVKGSSASRNGVLTNHHIVEVNGVNVLGLSDKKIRDLIRVSGGNVKLTLIPSFFYDHLSKKLGRIHLKHMDRSQPMV